ncbi:DNA-binding transcriptional regulator, LysR family [Parasphingorhabdus marina DSM 22363]|uniref:DNA-binding transcriptional regulator, LysR family n=1 Tax=Parasphingorhabdus marina DSM 22363 TaxID=1123272 RepID=A0A1N6DA37_9SPHN|nr:LysR substrate-binding domain-containing protein [Parasphingorhabdus marina]SIN67660.1 DNA-binding transcriptional regulator, LysR family [Parasphingorhabdus marina DSM 22363]
MELRQLRYFVAVAEERNFGLAAQKLNVSQPPITRQIKKLEDEMSVVLFKRTSKGSELTSAGQAFLEDARKILNQVKIGVERGQAAQRGEIGTLEIGYFGTPSYLLLPKILKLFKGENPGLELYLHRLSKKEQMDALKTGQIHIGFGRYYNQEHDLCVEHIFNEGMALCLPADFSMEIDNSNWHSVFSQIPLILFPASGRPNFADEILAILKREGVDPEVANVSEDIRAGLMQVAIGTGAMIVPNSVTEMRWFGVRFVKLAALSDDCPISIIYRKSDTSPHLRKLIHSIQHFQESSAKIEI